MSLFNRKKEELQLVPAPPQIDQDLGSKIVAMIPDYVQTFLLNILKYALKTEKAACLVMYIKDREKSNKKISQEVNVITFKYDPVMKIRELEDQLKELHQMRHRNNFLEKKYLDLLKSKTDGVQSDT